MGRGAKSNALVAAPNEFAEDVVEQLLERLRSGEPLTRIATDKRMPAANTVYRWVDEDAGFAERFHSARAIGVHALAEQCLDIADEPSSDAVEVADKRVRIDTRLRLAGKWLPRIYGDKVDVTSGGERIGLSTEIEAARQRREREARQD